MTPAKQYTSPHIHVDTNQHGMPAQLYWPADSDPALIVSQFPTGFFTWDDRRGCATFDSHRSTEVMNAAHRDFPEVGLSYGRSVREMESETVVKRTTSARPENWRAMGPRIPAPV